MRRAFLGVLVVLALWSAPAMASFTRSGRAAVSTFSANTLAAPTAVTLTHCTLSATLVVNWTHSTSTFVTSQLVEVSTSPTIAATFGTATFANNTTQTKTFSGAGALTVYYARVTAKFDSWSTASAIATQSINALC